MGIELHDIGDLRRRYIEEAKETWDIDDLIDALNGDRGDDQQEIARAALEITSMLLRKNADYGSSAWSRPILAPHLASNDAILCRMSDKIARLNRLSEADPQVKSESIRDTMLDLGGYAILWLANPQRE